MNYVDFLFCLSAFRPEKQIAGDSFGLYTGKNQVQELVYRFFYR